MTITRRHKYRKYKKSHSSLKGGKVIGAGGFGCIFNPSLKCKNNERVKNNISKLMKNKYVHKEYNEVIKFNTLLKNIPNYSHYFLLDGFSICKPSTLTPKDLENFNEKCSSLKKMGIKDDNINNPEILDKLLALNMPYGGVDVGKFIDEYWNNSKKMIALNNSLIKMLEHGIIPMNDAGVFHCDLKSSNILVSEEKGTLYTRLIDWGLSTNYSHDGPIPKVITDRPFQFNVPFSNILFTSLFTKMYKSFLVKHSEPDFYSLRTFVINYVLEWVEARGPGHLKSMNSIFKTLFENELISMDETLKGKFIEFDYTFYFIFEYITKILVKFTKNGEFDSKAYLTQVFLKNIDLWGFVVSYIPMVEDIISSNKVLTATQKEILNKVRGLMLILIDANDHPINEKELIKKLKLLNPSLVHLTGKNFKHKSSSMNASSNETSSTSLSDKSSNKSSNKSSDSSQSSNRSSLNKKKIISELDDVLNSSEKKAIDISEALSKGTRKIIKKKRFHKMILKTLKNIKSLHSKKQWM